MPTVILFFPRPILLKVVLKNLNPHQKPPTHIKNNEMHFKALTINRKMIPIHVIK